MKTKVLGIFILLLISTSIFAKGVEKNPIGIKPIDQEEIETMMIDIQRLTANSSNLSVSSVSKFQAEVERSKRLCEGAIARLSAKNAQKMLDQIEVDNLFAVTDDYCPKSLEALIEVKKQYGL